MQRDAYATIVRHRNRRKIPVRVLQLNGAVFRENLIEEFFIGYRNRRLALMTHTPGQDQRLPRLPKDIIVPDYKTFLQIHQPHFMYRLLPLLSSDVEAFAAMQAICASPGSPFTIEDRHESQLLNYRFSKLCAGRDNICEFLKDYTTPEELRMPAATRNLPIQGVSFQGLLVHEGRVSIKQSTVAPTWATASSPIHPSGNAAKPPAAVVHVRDGSLVLKNASEAANSDKGTSPTRRISSIAALITTHDALSESAIIQRALMAKFFDSDLYNQFGTGTVLSTQVRSMDERIHFMAVKRICIGRKGTVENMRGRTHLLHLAQRHNIHVYEKVSEGEYVYAAM